MNLIGNLFFAVRISPDFEQLSPTAKQNYMGLWLIQPSGCCKSSQKGNIANM